MLMIVSLVLYTRYRSFHCRCVIFQCFWRSVIFSQHTIVAGNDVSDQLCLLSCFT